MRAMNAKERKRLEDTVEALGARLPKRSSQSLQPAFILRVLKRLSGFTETCEKCQELLAGLAQQIEEVPVGSGQGELSREELRSLHKAMDRAVTHLQNRHKLVVQGQSTSIYLAMGLSLGLVFGQALFANMGLGLALGVAVGVAVGSGLEAKAKKDDRLI